MKLYSVRVAGKGICWVLIALGSSKFAGIKCIKDPQGNTVCPSKTGLNSIYCIASVSGTIHNLVQSLTFTTTPRISNVCY